MVLKTSIFVTCDTHNDSILAFCAEISEEKVYEKTSKKSIKGSSRKHLKLGGEGPSISNTLADKN